MRAGDFGFKQHDLFRGPVLSVLSANPIVIRTYQIYPFFIFSIISSTVFDFIETVMALINHAIVNKVEIKKNALQVSALKKALLNSVVAKTTTRVINIPNGEINSFFLSMTSQGRW